MDFYLKLLQISLSKKYFSSQGCIFERVFILALLFSQMAQKRKRNLLATANETNQSHAGTLIKTQLRCWSLNWLESWDSNLEVCRFSFEIRVNLNYLVNYFLLYFWALKIF